MNLLTPKNIGILVVVIALFFLAYNKNLVGIKGYLGGA